MQPMLRWMHSFRVRVLLVVCLVAGVPLGLMGLWITGSASQASEELLRARVAEVLEHVVGDIVGRWVRERSAVLDIAESPLVRQVVRNGVTVLDEDFLTRALTLRDATGRTIRAVEPEDPLRLSEPSIPLSVPVHVSALGPRIGSLEVTVPIESLLSGRRISPGGVQIIVGVFDARTGAPLVPLPFAWPTETTDAVEWGGDRWFVQARSVAEPQLELVGAAPLTPFEQPLRAAARRGLWMLLVVSALGLALASVLTRRVTRSLDQLTDVAEAVSGGTLELQVAEGGGVEFDRLARAFNRMTASLRTTLQQLAEQRALARIGEFGASLAHEVRNPLTAIRVDLQVVEEALPDQSPTLRPLRRALGEVDRLNDVVENALLATRLARTDLSPVDLRVPLEAAADAARKTIQRPLSIPIQIRSAEPLVVAGDRSALEQLFLNLLLNAVEAVRDRGEVAVVAGRDGDEIFVWIQDSGTGLTPAVARQAFEPFFTAREGGTGLGLTIASRLVRAHTGSVELEPLPEGGALAKVRLPAYERKPA